MSFATFVGAKVRIIIYIVSDLLKTLRMINKISRTIFNCTSFRFYSWNFRDNFHFTARIITFLYHLDLDGDAFLQLFHVADDAHMPARLGMQ